MAKATKAGKGESTATTKVVVNLRVPMPHLRVVERPDDDGIAVYTCEPVDATGRELAKRFAAFAPLIGEIGRVDLLAQRYIDARRYRTTVEREGVVDRAADAEADVREAASALDAGFAAMESIAPAARLAGEVAGTGALATARTFLADVKRAREALLREPWHPDNAESVARIDAARRTLADHRRGFEATLEAAEHGDWERAAPAPVSPGACDDNRTGGTHIDWSAVQALLLAKRERGEPYTSLRTLATELGCSDSSIRKAIKGSDLLKGWKARSAKPKAAPKATDLGAVARDNVPQSTEPAPDDLLTGDDVDIVMAWLIDQAGPVERAELHALDDAGRRAAVVAYQARGRDVEQVRLHKRA